MGYLPKQLLHKAYLTLSTLTEDHKQGQTQLTSALRHLFAFDMYYKEQEEDCDLDYAENRDEFTQNVKKIQNKTRHIPMIIQQEVNIHYLKLGIIHSSGS